ncbi:hypothetical protein [Azospirillum sp.]|uniref:hypothetical protein n=1 Tax=Azospirillum sp. TaxID=34012 RepID=UPI0026111F98|nr:hypothetical protein [Azospirillum sp.]
MDFVQAAANAIALLPPLLPAILDGGAKEIGKTAVAATLDQGKKVWGLLSGTPSSGPVIVAVEAVAAKPDDAALQDALKGQIIALLATNATLLRQVADALADGKGGNTVTASGAGSVAIGGAVSGSTITTNVTR